MTFVAAIEAACMSMSLGWMVNRMVSQMVGQMVGRRSANGQSDGQSFMEYNEWNTVNLMGAWFAKSLVFENGLRK